MQQILGAIITIVILVAIAFVLVFLCGGVKLTVSRTDTTDSRSTDSKKEKIFGREKKAFAEPSGEERASQPTGRAAQTKKTNHAASRNDAVSEMKTVHADDGAWVIELISKGNHVERRYSLSEVYGRDMTLGRSEVNDIQIEGYRDMSRQHIVIGCDNGGVYLIAADKCSSTITVNGKRIFDGRDLDEASARERQDYIRQSKLYLRDSMTFELGSARFRVLYF